MFYYKKVIIEDKELFAKVTDYKLSQLAQTSQPYLNSVKNGKLIISEKQYLKLKSIVDKEIKK